MQLVPKWFVVLSFKRPFNSLNPSEWGPRVVNLPTECMYTVQKKISPNISIGVNVSKSQLS
jgi:hypothetical protein